MPDNRTNPDDQEQIGRSVNEEATGTADDVEDEDDLDDADQKDDDAESAESPRGLRGRS